MSEPKQFDTGFKIHKQGDNLVLDMSDMDLPILSYSPQWIFLGVFADENRFRRILREIVSDAMAGVGYDDGTCIYCAEPIHDNGAGHAGKCPIYRGRAFMDIPIPKREEDDDG